jgi:hypothetical protein
MSCCRQLCQGAWSAACTYARPGGLCVSYVGGALVAAGFCVPRRVHALTSSRLGFLLKLTAPRCHSSMHICLGRFSHCSSHPIGFGDVGVQLWTRCTKCTLHLAGCKCKGTTRRHGSNRRASYCSGFILFRTLAHGSYSPRTYHPRLMLQTTLDRIEPGPHTATWPIHSVQQPPRAW